MKKVLYIIAIVGVVVIIGYSISGSSSDEAYRNQIADARGERVRYLKNSENSPFAQADIKYQPLTYFPINAEYRVRANLERVSSPYRVTIRNTDGSTSSYSKFAYAKFKLKGQAMSLLILKPADFGAVPNTYLTAFADMTSGATTYGGGRYLDLDIGGSDNIVIDFNLAYNPYCAYVPDYSCPLPPPDNLLRVAIEAGEKDYKH